MDSFICKENTCYVYVIGNQLVFVCKENPLIKNTIEMNKAKIHYYDIGDYLSREDKLRVIKQFGSIERIPWTILQPNEHGDWINHRNEMFKLFIPIEPEKKFVKGQKSFFETYAIGVATNRDAWVYNSSQQVLERNMRSMIDFPQIRN